MTQENAAVPDFMTEPSGLMRLVAYGLCAHDLEVRLPDCEDSYRLRLNGPHVRCDLTVSDSWCVEWECSPCPPGKADPKLIADIVTALLAGSAQEYPRKGTWHGNSALTFKAIVADELKARGLAVDLEVYADESYYDAYAVIEVTNPGVNDGAKVTVTDQGEILWERDYWPEATMITWELKYPGQLIDPEKVADSITETVCKAMSLASACASDENG